ncbi:MAG: bifunctional molybdenum cofactor biosynthesis protein MoaC/MoaB [Aureispira sp.]
MVDITHKSSTLREATAEARVLVSHPDTITAIKNKTVPKGDVLEMAKVAGLFGVKKTAELIPDCHPLPIEYTNVSYEIKDRTVIIQVTVKTIYKTGVEVEAMHGASLVALTMYDMLKPIDKGIEISTIKLLKKRGGKSDYRGKHPKNLQAAVIVCSDSISAGKKEDKAGKAIIKKLETTETSLAAYTIIPDEKEAIEREVNHWCTAGIDLLIFTGGTGLSPRDVTPETIQPLLDREVPGIAEAMRNYGQERTPYSMLSRSVAGIKEQTLIITLPGSTKGAKESMDAIFPAILHIFAIMKGQQH